MKRHLIAPIGVLLILIGTIVAHIMSIDGHSPLVLALLDSLHAPGFALLTVVTLLALPPEYRSVQSTIRVAIGVAFTAILLEGAQVFFNRDADIGDLLADVVGILSAACAYVAILGFRRKLFTWVSLALAVATVAGPLIAAHAVIQQRLSVPILADFESGWQSSLYAGTPPGHVDIVGTPPHWPKSTGHVARVLMSIPKLAGIELHPFGNWLGYHELAFDIASADDRSFEISLRIHDAHHTSRYYDRFRTKFEIGDEPRTIRIPLTDVFHAPRDRRMDLARISALVFFVAEPSGGEVMLLDNIRLE